MLLVSSRDASFVSNVLWAWDLDARKCFAILARAALKYGLMGLWA
jgi:hypothetical protein